MLFSSPDGRKEADTVACVHCNRHSQVKPKQDPATLGGFCQNCCGYVCGPCHHLGTCSPFMKQVEAAESRARFLKGVGETRLVTAAGRTVDAQPLDPDRPCETCGDVLHYE